MRGGFSRSVARNSPRFMEKMEWVPSSILNTNTLSPLNGISSWYFLRFISPIFRGCPPVMRMRSWPWL